MEPNSTIDENDTTISSAAFAQQVAKTKQKLKKLSLSQSETDLVVDYDYNSDDNDENPKQETKEQDLNDSHQWMFEFSVCFKY